MNSCPPPINCGPAGPRIDIPITRIEYKDGVLRAFTNYFEEGDFYENREQRMVQPEKSFEVVCNDATFKGDIVRVKDRRSADYLIVNPETYASIIIMLGSKNTDDALDVLRRAIHARIDSSFAALKKIKL